MMMMMMMLGFISGNERVFWGGLLVIFGSTFFGGFLYTAVISKLVPHSDIIFAIQNDRYGMATMSCFLFKNN